MQHLWVGGSDRADLGQRSTCSNDGNSTDTSFLCFKSSHALLSLCPILDDCGPLLLPTWVTLQLVTPSILSCGWDASRAQGPATSDSPSMTHPQKTDPRPCGSRGAGHPPSCSPVSPSPLPRALWQDRRLLWPPSRLHTLPAGVGDQRAWAVRATLVFRRLGQSPLSLSSSECSRVLMAGCSPFPK